MFETSSVRGNSRVHPLTLTVSAVLHVTVAGVVTFVTIWDVETPSKVPDQVVGFQVSAPPPPPVISRGAPDSVRSRAADPVTETRQTPVEAAPVEIPDLVVSLDTAIDPVDGDGGPEPFGDPAGEPGGDPDGTVFGTGDTNGDGDGTLDGTYTVGNGVSAPVTIRTVDPVYPPLLKRLALSGVVQLQCVISKNGALTDIRVIESSHPLFEQSAITAVEQWRFLPGSFNGSPVNTRFELTVNFNLQR